MLNCIDCGKQLSKKKYKRCRNCYNKYARGKNHPRYVDGRTNKKHYCLNCGKEINRNAKRCHSCDMKEKQRLGIINNKGKNHPRYINGEYLKKHDCKQCNKEITYETWKNGSGLCGSCASKKRLAIPENNPNYIDGRTLLIKLIRNLAEYKEWRIKVFNRDNYTCQDCGDNKGHNLNAHHEKLFVEIYEEFLKEYDQFSPIEDKETLVRLAIKWKPFWDINNGKTLCKDCHKNKIIIRR